MKLFIKNRDKKENCAVHKIRSEKGITIILALFTLLICSTIAAVVITSASAAGGKTSQLAEMDQRYYNVLSAANLMRENLNGQKIIVTKTEEKTVVYTTVTEKKDDGTVDQSSPTPTETFKYKFAIDNSNGKSVIIKDSILNICFGENQAPVFSDSFAVSDDTNKAQAYYNYDSENPNWSEIKRDFEMSHTFSDADFADAEALAVTVKSTLRSDGKLYLNFQNKNDSKGKYYKLHLIMNPSIETTSVESDPVTTLESTTEGNKVTTKETVVTTTTKTITLTWTQGALKKI